MRKLSDVLKQQYGRKVRRLALSGGRTCPNRDGTKSIGGCTFCSLGGSGEFASALSSTDEEILAAKRLLKEPEDAEGFIAYFQSFTATYGDFDEIARRFEEVLRRDDIWILAIATRPDCIDDRMLDLLVSMNRIKPVWIELGLQTMHDFTAERINRCYPLSVFEETYHRLKDAGLTVIVHMILGLPGESREDMLESMRYLGTLHPDGVKIGMLQILKGTALAEEYLEHPFPLLSMEDYCDLVEESIRILPDDTIIHRMTGDPARDLLIAPEWTLHKKRVLNAITRRLARR